MEKFIAFGQYCNLNNTIEGFKLVDGKYQFAAWAKNSFYSSNWRDDEYVNILQESNTKWYIKLIF